MTTPTYRVLTPTQYSGSPNGDYGFEINGQRSERGYATRSAALAAMVNRVVIILETEQKPIESETLTESI